MLTFAGLGLIAKRDIQISRQVAYFDDFLLPIILTQVSYGSLVEYVQL